MLFGFSDFVRVSAIPDSNPPTQIPSANTDLTPLLPFGNPPHHSTPDHQMSCQEDPRTLVDTDGIRHSFDRSMQVLNSSESRPDTNVRFLVPEVAEGVNVQREDGHRVLPTSDPNRLEVAEREDLACGFYGTTPPMSKTCLSPFSSFLNRTSQSTVSGISSPTANAPTAPTTSQLPLAGSYVTNFDLMALEQRMQILVSEATTSIRARLVEQFSPLATRAHGTPTGTETSGTNVESSLMVSPASTTEEQDTPPAGLSRRERRQLRAREQSSSHNTPGDQHSASKRPRPRMQLTSNMYKKHPIFKFFVTAPVDSINNPHKWRCRVCLIELSLKTKGSLEILSHYKTDAHLVREHRIRMETPGLPLYGKDEIELVGTPLAEARERAELEIPIAPILGECYLLPGQRKLPVPTDELDPTTVVCSQIRILFTGLQYGGNLSNLTSLWGKLGLEIRGPVKMPQYDWSPEHIFVSIITFNSCFSMIIF